jgi:hypothetical protein
MTHQIKRLISVEEFDNTGPVKVAYPQTYKLKTCIICSKDATKIVLYSIDNNIIVHQRYCSRHGKRIKS